MALALVVISFQNAYASGGEHIPWGDFLLRVLNAAIFLGIIWYVAGKLIKKFFVDRRAGIVREMDELALRKEEAEKRLAELEQNIANVEQECAKLLEDGKTQAENLKAKILADAEVQAAHIVEQAKVLAEQEGKAEIDAIREKMADLIVSKTEESLLKHLDAKMHQKLIDKSLTKVVLQ